MATLPHSSGNGNRCPQCHRKDCPCFKVGCSMVYKIAIGDVRGIFGWTFRSGSLREDWQEIARRLKSWRYKKGL